MIHKTLAGASGSFRSLRLGALLLGLLVAPAGAVASDEFDRAMQAYEAGHYGESLPLLQQAADHGHVGAQEMLGLMYWYGPTLYGSDVPRSAYRSLDMLDRAATGGSEVAQHMLATMTRRTLLEARTAAVEEYND
jgi:TPR repeat protein